jgi:AraC-like DNA-binding protein
MKIDLSTSAVSRSIRSAVTLKHALETFVWYSAREDTTSIYTIIGSGLNIRVTRTRSSYPPWGAQLYTDLDFFIDLTTIIREFAGRHWFPKHIAFQHWPPASGPHLYFPNTRFLFDKNKSWIELPRSLLLVGKQPSSPLAGFDRTRLRHLARKDTTAFVYALKRKLRESGSDGYPDIAQAAQIMGTSVRTLQRALSGAGVTYSKVVEYARFEAAAERLSNPNLKIIDIASSLGYQDPSHFSRAFRRISGLTPRAFRLARFRGATAPKTAGEKARER